MGTRKSRTRNVPNHAARKRANMVALDRELAMKPLAERPTTIGDLRNLQEMHGINMKDFSWLTAFTARDVPMSPPFSTVRLDSVGKRAQLPILVRFLTSCLVASPLPPEPLIEDILPVIFQVLQDEDPELVIPGQNPSWGKVSICLGTTDWSGHTWFMGGAKSPLVQRIILSLYKAMQSLGVAETARLYRASLTAEARSRGFESLGQVIRRKSWHNSPKKAHNDLKSLEETPSTAALSRKQPRKTGDALD